MAEINNVHTRLRQIAETHDGGEARWWVNDSGATLRGMVGENEPGYPTATVEGYVGLVDERIGGMIAYGEAEIMESLADQLNELHVIKTILGLES